MEPGTKKKRARQSDLPGMEGRKIADLHTAAEDYAEIRDERMALTPKEVAAKADVLKLMKKHKLQHYQHGSVEIEVITEEETVKVKVKDPRGDTDD